MSYNNLAIYDSSLLSNVDAKIYYVGNELYDSINLEDVEFYPFFNYSNKSTINKATSYIISLLKILKLIKRLDPDVIHIQWIRLWFADYLFLKLLLKKGRKIVYTSHNVLPHKRKRNDFKKYKKYYELLDSIIVHSSNSKEELISDFIIDKNKISVVPHGLLDLSISIDNNKVEKLKNELINRYDLNNKIVFSTLGTQDKYKGSDLIFEVWKDSLSENSNVFLFAGGKISNDLLYVAKSLDIEDLENTYINFNRIEDELFLAILQVTDIILLPYRRISQSGVLLSAINEQVPFLVSNAGGISDALSIGNVGWNIGYASQQSLRENLINIINNPKDINAKKNNVVEWSKLHKYYSWKEIGNKTMDVYKSILNIGE